MEFSGNSNLKQQEKELELEMDKHLKNFQRELSKIRTGRANPAMVEDIRVVCYGKPMPLKELASISAPEASMLVIQPWDKSLLSDMEKAVSLSDLGVSIQNDGEILRIKIPPMSSSRRDELVKSVHQKLEATKVVIRNIRKDVQNKIRDAEKTKKISEDISKSLQEMLQKVTDKFIKLGDLDATKKESEIKNL